MNGKKFRFYVVPVEKKAIVKILTNSPHLLDKKKKSRWINDKDQKKHVRFILGSYFSTYLFLNSLFKKEWLDAFRGHVQYATRQAEFRRIGERLNVQIGKVEQNLVVNNQKLFVC